METTKTKAPVFNARIDGNYGEFVLEPLERGFGVTLGNPLRRILLSSIPGTAVTSVYIEDVLHEFSTIPGVKEDAIQLILNLKELVVRFANPGSGPKTLTLRASGPKVVYARDLECPPDAEIVNPDQYIATLEDKGKLVMEVRVDEGTGYVPAEKHGIKDRISSIPVDALYSPVRRVAYQVEDTRLGQRTDLDKLTLRIWTNGAVSPMDVLQQSVAILREQLGFFDQSPVVRVEHKPTPVAAPVTPVATSASTAAPVTAPVSKGVGLTLDDLGLTTRVLHNLKEEGIESVESLLALSERELKKVPGIGDRSLQEIKDCLAQHGLVMKD
ncbi:DNA-directed RNA polymerase subunit alpha [Meiothermus hypogaeus]|uniref:DNA-directed RNA polymerase subunit alpha n=2 Tax=Meiothermus hypogaeus TaxID=884155 RepID=A0A511R2Q1_9DEIN|nr:DNA-directed RNA polymerase subunit alpha [Meiothermus hypogaeus]RIH78256.1 DNA-directed RNA polymerase subunit alpha [Meiothermus hypogaeus]GEM83849.1 DNA-directed RNA polymerase subunit alpha [Meiothermus hypogaeus NBRC 106114]